MTYCLALAVDEGLVFASDSRTNAGVDHVSAYRKMHPFAWPGERVFVLLAAGNLATTQEVVRRLHREIDDGGERSLASVPRVDDAAAHLGALSATVQQRAARTAGEGGAVAHEATFILGGQIADAEPALYLVYPQGNFIGVSEEKPFFQIGETKYGKPILDRIVTPGLGLESAARCALVSIDSTMRSNLSVGPPVELLRYQRDSLSLGAPLSLGEQDARLRRIREAWGSGLKRLFDTLPGLD